MALLDTPDQTALAASVRQLVGDHAPLTRVREVMDSDTGFDPDLWRRLADAGLPAIGIPEEHGGAGGSLADLAAALRELGRGLVPSPLLATVLAGHALLHLDDEPVRKELLPELASGELVATLAVSEGDGTWVSERPTTAARRLGDGVVLDGTKRAVLNGAEAGALLVHARDGAGSALFLVRAGAAGLCVAAESGLDATTATATVTLEQTPAVRLSGDATRALGRVLDLANVAIACAQAAATRQAVEVTAEYAKTRLSFGQPIGSYQGVKHKLADAYTEWCLVDALVRRAVEAADAGDPEAGALAAAARLLSGPAYVNAAKQMMMLHGGIGFTWEHDAHLFYKNAVSSSVLLGGADARARLAELLAL